MSTLAGSASRRKRQSDRRNYSLCDSHSGRASCGTNKRPAHQINPCNAVSEHSALRSFVKFGVKVAGVSDVDFLITNPNAISAMVPTANLGAATGGAFVSWGFGRFGEKNNCNLRR